MRQEKHKFKTNLGSKKKMSLKSKRKRRKEGKKGERKKEKRKSIGPESYLSPRLCGTGGVCK